MHARTQAGTRTHTHIYIRACWLLTEITEEDEEKEEETETGESSTPQMTDPPAEGDSSDSSAAKTSQRPLDLPYGMNEFMGKPLLSLKDTFLEEECVF